ncbi:MAG: hypothetical protein LBH32_01720 [Dysgonamonadaceae bacterium]|jgi:hypothetical protein|nr:hypothetical protein [Dysgonamonadaceae bacterium]
MAENSKEKDVLCFEMSKETKKKWLSTRKAGKQVVASDDLFRLPGLFETVEYSQDKTLFSIAMALEIIGFLLISALADFGVLIAATVAAFVVIDVFLAIGIHWKESLICENLNRMTTASGDMRAGYKTEVKKAKNWFPKYLFIIILWVLAVAKAGAIFVLNPESYVFGILAFLIYGFIAYVHTFKTGFWLAEWRRKRKLEKEKEKYKLALIAKGDERDNVENNTKEYREHPLSGTPDDIKPIIIEKGTSEGKRIVNAVLKQGNDWKLFTWGLLEDKDLQDLLQGSDNLKKYLAVECLKAQLHMLGENAKNAGGVSVDTVINLIDLNKKENEKSTKS